MIIPLKDDCYFEGKTLVTRSIMVVCLVALLGTLSLFPVGSHPVEMAMNLSRVREFLEIWALVPGNYRWLWLYPFFTSLFLHAGSEAVAYQPGHGDGQQKPECDADVGRHALAAGPSKCSFS